MHRQNAEQTLSPCSTFSVLPGEGEVVCWKAPRPPRLCSPPVPLAEPPGHANTSAHGGKLSLPSPGSREIPAGGVLGTPSHGLPERWAPCPETGEQLSPWRKSNSPAPTSAGRASCNWSRAERSHCWKRGCEGADSPAADPLPGEHRGDSEGTGAGEDGVAHTRRSTCW